MECKLIADLTADAVQSLAINHANGPVTLSQPLPENAVTLNMTNAVPTNRSDDMGNIVTVMVGELELTARENL